MEALVRERGSCLRERTQGTRIAEERDMVRRCDIEGDDVENQRLIGHSLFYIFIYFY